MLHPPIIERDGLYDNKYAIAAAMHCPLYWYYVNNIHAIWAAAIVHVVLYGEIALGCAN